jgi:NAD(P)-dependent dehydrogenase (short-subunit alcohol dehydrogenase family)
LLPRGIRVNTISPGATFTPIFGRLGLSAAELDATAAGLLKTIPIGRFATADDIAAGVAYLGSADAAYVVGAELTIDGGLGQL